MQVEVIEGLFLGQVFPVVEVGTGERKGQYLLWVGTLDNGENRGSWFYADRCRVIAESVELCARDKALDELVTLEKITNFERVQYVYKKESLGVARCNLITDMLIDLLSIEKPQVKRARGQRGKGKKEAAVSVSMRIPADVLKMIDDKAAFNGMDRTAMILSILSKGY